MIFLRLKSLCFSALLHILIFSLFIFTFPVRSPSHKPNFIFLGSILKNQDIVNFFASQATPPVSTEVTKDLINKRFDADMKPFSVFQSNKPFTLNEISKNKKIDLKSTFNLKNQQKQINKKTFAGLKKMPDVEIPPYKPLTLEDK